MTTEPELLINEFIDDYYAECDEHLADVRSEILALERSVGRTDLEPAGLDALLRAFHSIKGLSGMVGVGAAEQLAHHIEGQLRSLRDDHALLTPRILQTLVDATVLMEQVIGARRAGQPIPSVEPLIAALTAPAPSASALAASEASAGTAAGLNTREIAHFSAAQQRGDRVWRFEFSSAPELAARGITVNTVRQRLTGIGEVIRARPHLAQGGRVMFEFVVASGESEDIFEAWTIDGLAWAPFEPTAVEPVDGLTEDLTAGAQPAAEQLSHPAVPTSNMVRVELSRLDDLMQQVGELTIARARLSEQLGQARAALPTPVWRALQETNLTFERQLRTLRDSAMRLRMVPIGDIFARMQFVVNDLGRSTGKQILVEVSGQNTEIDKLLVERMMDPLLHLVRNAVSHGLETPADRTAQGKPGQGTLALRATTAGDRVVIQVEDDGRGIDVASVTANARSTGMLAADAELDARGLLEMICRPGFSTRNEADMASGRGIGMAVVRDTILEMGGSLALDTTPGRGTCFTIELPLTLAIIDVLVVLAGGQRFAVPQGALREIVEVGESTVRPLGRHEFVQHRGALLPIVRLAGAFGMPQERRERLHLLVVGEGADAVAIAVERVVGQQEIVVRAVTDPLVRSAIIGGATELGNGRPTLIVNPAGLVHSDGWEAPAGGDGQEVEGERP